MMHEDPQLKEQEDPDEKQHIGSGNNSSRRQKESLEIETGDGADDIDNNDEYEYYYDDDDDIAPLIQNSSGDPPAHDQTSRRVQDHHHPGRRSPRRGKHLAVRGSYLFKQLMAAHDDDDRSCWHRTRGTVAQLAAMLIFLFVASFIFAPQAPPSNLNDGIDHCEAIMNISIAELMSLAGYPNSTKASNSTTSPGVYDPDDEFCVDDETMRKYRISGCRCPPPGAPTPKMSKGSIEKPWVDTFERNKALVKDAVFTAARTKEQIDVVFYGDSITEHWVGTDLNRASFGNVVNDSKVFQEYFGGDHTGATLKGIALGIGGDMCEHVLYRIQNGELPSSLHSKVYWILIGTNDLVYGCNSESIAAGTIKIAQEIQEKTRQQRNTESSTIILNSILPRAGGTAKHPITNVFDTNNDFQWSTIQRINQWLQCYADSTVGVEFFNATDIFLDEDGNGINEYFDDAVHPSAEGHKKWAEAIVKKVNEILA